MASSATVVEFETEFWIEFGTRQVVPVGTEILGRRLDEGYLVVEARCIYDYAPFSDGYAPAFDFQATVLEATLFGELLDPVEVTCTSSPDGEGARITTIKE
ncbi:hypothetical protein KNU13_gp50 [Gordonia phage Turuncu]|uniref:DUF7233 domain-containing protein n=1 Tax=Gordonia phage Turuncu TaxID=2315610 RepID=A0A386KAP7_9CAUD|nr:hypothetical protein KNU13_gp50 [Gordonia phage Turuncu]AYD82137.1 hypothetical protein SEA_TURUNCU_50 [Gordonia phage Turuncu]